MPNQPDLDDHAEPYLSVVVTTRNDDHGGDPLKRLQALVNTFDEQCRRTTLAAELIVVEWNPTQDRPRVSSLLRLPDPAFCTYRFIEVPPELHQTLRYADVLPLFQMIAKNVGIRRARGQFVLATNIDIICANELIAYIARGELRDDRLYRVDRHDIQPNVPLDAPLEAQMAYCASHQIRIHRRNGSFPVDAEGRSVMVPSDIADGRSVRLGKGWHVRELAGQGRSFRWATECAELLIDVEAAGLPTPGAILELEIESNPYDAVASPVVLIEDGRPAVETHVLGHLSLQVPLDARKGVRRIEIGGSGPEGDVRCRLPVFERRSGMFFRVYSARLIAAAASDLLPFEYPRSGWTNPDPSSALEAHPTDDGFAVSSDPRAFSYCLRYGPFRAPRRGTYRFALHYILSDGAIALGALTGDQQKWIPATTIQFQDREDESLRRIELTVDLMGDTFFWLMISNDRKTGKGVSRFEIRSLRGSEAPADIMPPRLQLRRQSNTARIAYASAALRGRRLVEELTFDRRRARLLKIADRFAELCSHFVWKPVRYRLARATPEFQAIERALEESDTRLREIAPLQYLSGFNDFLRDRRPDNLHLNGCGDFQLLARERWCELRGYPEFETFSMNIDGLFSYIAHASGITEEVLEMPIYHLEHEVGSGWSPEGEALLRRRIAERGITWLDASTVYIWAAYMHWLHRPMVFNSCNWGMARQDLPERVVRPGR
jgi:hypothetical protein